MFWVPLLLLATTLGYYHCVPIGSDDELKEAQGIFLFPRSEKKPSPREDAPQSNHFCERMYAGQYSDIRLQSFSPCRAHIRMYESGNLYKIPRATMDKHKVELPEQYSKFSLNKTLGTYKPDDLKSEDVIAIYDIPQGDKDVWRTKYLTHLNFSVISFLANSHAWPTLRRSLILLTSTREYIWNLVFPWFDATLHEPETLQGRILSTKVRDRPDYALVYRQVKSEIAGYVINQDIYGPTNDFIIYDLSLESLQPSVQFRDATHEQKESAPYFYVQKTYNPSEVLLVHRSNYDKVDNDKTDRALFHSLPHGFVHQFNTDFRIFIYLFDSDLGCVYVLEDLGRLARQFKHKQDLTVKRINIPYEEFFICLPEYRSNEYRMNSSRCNTTIADLGKSGLIRKNPLYNLNHQQAATSTKSNNVRVGWIVIIVFAWILVFAAFCFCLLMSCRHKEPAPMSGISETERMPTDWQDHTLKSDLVISDLSKVNPKMVNPNLHGAKGTVSFNRNTLKGQAIPKTKRAIGKTSRRSNSKPKVGPTQNSSSKTRNSGKVARTCASKKAASRKNNRRTITRKN